MHFFTPQRLGRFKGFAIQIFRSVCSSDSVLLSTCGFGDWAWGLEIYWSQLNVSSKVDTGMRDWGCGVGIGHTELSRHTDRHAGIGIGDWGLGLLGLTSASALPGVWGRGLGIGDWEWGALKSTSTLTGVWVWGTGIRDRDLQH